MSLEVPSNTFLLLEEISHILSNNYFVKEKILFLLKNLWNLLTRSKKLTLMFVLISSRYTKSHFS